MAQWAKLLLGMLPVSGGSSWGLQKPHMVNVIALLCHPSLPTVRWEMATKDPDAHRWASLGYAVVNKRPWLKQDRRWLLAHNVVLWPSHTYSGTHVSPADRKTDRQTHPRTCTHWLEKELRRAAYRTIPEFTGLFPEEPSLMRVWFM